MSFVTRLRRRWTDANTLLCVGLDPDSARFPAHLVNTQGAVFEFCKAIVDATADLACAFKPQIAYFAAQRAEAELESLIAYIKKTYPAVPVILDAKRGDMASTMEQYAREIFERYNADAVTLSPFQGLDSIEPFLAYQGRGAFLLCRTSNTGGNDVQMLKVGSELLYEYVARLVSSKWNTGGELGLVIGATFPSELANVRSIVDDMPLLVPGIGAQGGDIRDTVLAGRTSNGVGMAINSSRAILYAGSGEDFAQAARQVALRTRDDINRYRQAP